VAMLRGQRTPMSTSLYWRPAQPEPDGERLGYQLKWALARGGYFDHDGSCSTDWFLMGERDLPFLRGVAAAGNDEARQEAEQLIALIAQHGSVEVELR
jgi:hypothetical protein